MVNTNNNNNHNSSHRAGEPGPGSGLLPAAATPATPPTPPVDASQATSASAINSHQTQTQPASQARTSYGNPIKSPPETAGQPSADSAACKSHDSSNNCSSTNNSNSNSTTAAVAAAAAAAAAVNMPIGGVQGQNPTQGLVHWMSAVMAEHMTGQTHHDPSAAVGMHYMWNGNVDVSTKRKTLFTP